jgi:DNA-binding response OmpR family regulator
MFIKKNIAHQEEKTHVITNDDVAPAPKQILLLEDEPELASNLKEILEQNGFGVVVVQNGAAGLQQLMGREFDAIVCDMVMPGLPGDMFYLAVQRTKPHLCKRFVFITGHRADPKIDAFIRQTRGLLLWKPFEAHELLDAIQTVLRKAESA